MSYKQEKIEELLDLLDESRSSDLLSALNRLRFQDLIVLKKAIQLQLFAKENKLANLVADRDLRDYETSHSTTPSVVFETKVKT